MPPDATCPRLACTAPTSGRPSYPLEAIDWLLPAAAVSTPERAPGKLTTRLVERGLTWVAVDPIPR